MQRSDVFSLVTPGQSLAAVCLPGLVPAHGLSDSLSARFPDFAAGLTPFQAKRRVYSGKVRDRIDLGDRVFLFTSDRVSAFDVVLGLVPCKGEVLNRISLFWFDQTGDIVPNHVIAGVGSRGMICRKATVLPVEVVVRGYLTGSAWRDYQAGQTVSGIELPAGLRKDQQFAEPLITPSTKEDLGSHDQPIGRAEIISRGLVTKEVWQEVERAALGLFARGSAIAARQGLILVDTKYEFGLLPDGSLILVDEIHTPDSSRFWYADSYAELFTAGQEQRKLDKEYLRTWLMEQGWSGHGQPPAIPDAVFLELSWRYVQAFQEITGSDFQSDTGDFEAETRQILSLL